MSVFRNLLIANAMKTPTPPTPTALGYLEFYPEDGGVFSITASNGWDNLMETSVDDGAWTTWQGTTVTGNNIKVRGTGNTKLNVNTSSSTNNKWTITGENIITNGDLTALLDYNDVESGESFEIRDYCFYGIFRETPIKNISLGNITTVGDWGFSYCCQECTDLTSFVIPDSITTVGDGGFTSCCQGCSALTSFVISSSITTVGVRGFYYCCSGCSSLTSFVIPDSVTSIGNYGFLSCCQSCTSLTSFTIPDSITSVGNFGFTSCCWNCTSLTSFVIPDSITSVGEYGFRYCCRGCTSLTSFVIPDSITTIGDDGFSNCCEGCTSLEINTSSTPNTPRAFTIGAPDVTLGLNALVNMFQNTAGNVPETPETNTTYYATAI